jgi:hypothetical protein
LRSGRHGAPQACAFFVLIRYRAEELLFPGNKRMNPSAQIRAVSLVILAGVILYLAIRIWRVRIQARTRRWGVAFQLSIGFAWQDGFKSVALLLLNQSREHVWVEEIEIGLTQLEANDQTAEATCRKIRQSVSPRENLPISLVETIYNAAGRPQRRYSCRLSSIVRFRVGPQLFEEPLPTYSLQMLGLTVSKIRRECGPGYQFRARELGKGRGAGE